MIPVVVTMLLMITVIPPHAVITWRWGLFPLVFLLLMMFNAGLIFYAARLTSAIPDLGHVLGFVSRFWLYGSGVMFSLERFISHPTLLEVVQLNPAYCAIELSRELLVYGTHAGSALVVHPRRLGRRNTGSGLRLLLASGGGVRPCLRPSP